MANEEQLSILKQGAEVWNEWRATNLGVALDLGSADLGGADLSKVDFHYVDLSNTNFART